MKNLNQKGFTLVEVLAVIVIIAVLGLVTVPGVLSMIKNGEKSSYAILVDNIQTAGVSLYEEIDLLGNTVYSYTTNSAESSGTVTISSDDKIVVNLQTLVNNGYLKGVANDSASSNQNAMILWNPVTEQDMGSCEIVIMKQVVASTGKTTYLIENRSASNSSCPTSEEYKKGVK